jgi:hypothetical protein
MFGMMSVSCWFLVLPGYRASSTFVGLLHRVTSQGHFPGFTLLWSLLPPMSFLPMSFLPMSLSLPAFLHTWHVLCTPCTNSVPDPANRRTCEPVIPHFHISTFPHTYMYIQHVHSVLVKDIPSGILPPPLSPLSSSFAICFCLTRPYLHHVYIHFH